MVDHHAIYTDTWLSMGDSTPIEAVKQTFDGYQINSEIMAKTANGIFMHCQPTHRGVEVTAEVLDGPDSVIMQQAENRMHVQNAVMLHLLA